MFKIIKNKKNIMFLLVTFLFMIIQVSIVLIQAFLIGNVINSANNSNMELFYRCLIFTIIVALLAPPINWLYNVSKMKFICICSKNIKDKIFESYIYDGYINYHKTDVGSKISVLTNDLSLIEQEYLLSLIELIQALILFVCSAFIIIKINYKIGIFLLMASLFAALMPKLFSKNIDVLKGNVSNELSKYTGKVTEYLNGYNVIEAYNIRTIILNNFKQITTNTYNANISYYKKFHFMQAISFLFGSFTFIGGFLFGGYLVSTGTLSLGIMITCVQLSNNLTNPIYQLVRTLSSVQAMKKINVKIEKILSSNETKYHETEYHDNNQKMDEEFNSINLKNIFFSYDNEKIVLNDLNKIFEKGKKYMIVGKSGTGKSTIMNLILGRLKPSKGSIRVNNKYSELKKYIAFVEQNTFLFSGTLRENITLYREVCNEKVIEAMKMADISYMIEHLDDEDYIKENGKNFSGGERQRISIARGILENKPIILADEIFSSLDYDSAKKIEKNILNMLRDTTFILITHKIIDENKFLYDDIIQLSDGKLEEIPLKK